MTGSRVMDYKKGNPEEKEKENFSLLTAFLLT